MIFELTSENQFRDLFSKNISGYYVSMYNNIPEFAHLFLFALNNICEIECTRLPKIEKPNWDIELRLRNSTHIFQGMRLSSPPFIEFRVYQYNPGTDIITIEEPSDRPDKKFYFVTDIEELGEVIPVWLMFRLANDTDLFRESRYPDYREDLCHDIQYP